MTPRRRILGELGAHQTGLDEPDPHVLLGELLAQTLAERADGVLGRGVDVGAPDDLGPATELTMIMSATPRGPCAAFTRCGTAAIAAANTPSTLTSTMVFQLAHPASTAGSILP